MKVLTSAQMRATEQATEGSGISLAWIMRRAGEMVATAAAKASSGGQILVLVGPGNNGGDGLIAAGRLQAAHHPVRVYAFGRRETAGLESAHAEDDPEQHALVKWLEESQVVVEALLGTGASRPPGQLLSAILNRVNTTNERAYRIAVDIPAGVDPDTGAVPGEAFRATETLALGMLKVGNVMYPGAGLGGRLSLVDIGIPAELAPPGNLTVPDDREIAAILPRRNREANKGTAGRLLVVAGSRNFQGAPVLVSVAAYRMGAGLVELALPPSIQSGVVAHTLEPIYTQLPEVDGRVSPAALDALREPLSRAKAVVYGPGLGLSDVTVDVAAGLLGLLAGAQLHGIVIDADGLNALARIPQWWSVSPLLILTPHPGEMARLTGLPVDQIQATRLDTARHYAQQWGKIVVLKGPGTVIADPDGRAVVNPTGGQNLATAGSGDVLSGIIGGLLAQGMDPFDAAYAGVYLHGRAGDFLARLHGDVGTLAGDLPAVLPEVRKAILESEKGES